MNNRSGESPDFVYDDGNEPEPVLMLKIIQTDEQLRLDRRTATLYTFAGHLALHNHVYVVLDSEEPGGDAQGLYLWSETKGYDEVVDFMLANDYPAVINMPTVPEGDQDARVATLTADIDMDEVLVPADWA